MTEVAIPTPRGKLSGYLATPGGSGSWPGVVVIFDVGGISRDMRNQADWLAGHGYLALVPDLYRGRAGLGASARWRATPERGEAPSSTTSTPREPGWREPAAVRAGPA